VWLCPGQSLCRDIQEDGCPNPIHISTLAAPFNLNACMHCNDLSPEAGLAYASQLLKIQEYLANTYLGLVYFAKVSNFFSTLFPSHHIKCTKSHMFGAVNVGKKIINYTVLMYFATRIF
jgi:hypothetical protein